MSDAPPPGPEPDPPGDPRPYQNVILVGYRGSGKTSVGRRLAQRFGWSFVDTDDRVEAAAGMSISAIFAQRGESAFRQLESEALAAAARERRQVISVGGGAVISEANRGVLRSAGVCIWLNASPEELHRRMQADPHSAATRPPLTGLGSLDEARHLLDRRRPMYAAVADHVVDTTAKSIEQVVETVMSRLAGHAASSETP